jgi:hypothetical protein
MATNPKPICAVVEFYPVVDELVEPINHNWLIGGRLENSAVKSYSRTL